MFAIGLYVIAAAVTFLLSYLGAHDNVHALPEAKRVVRKRQFILLGTVGMAIVIGQGIIAYLDRERSEAASAAATQKNADVQAALIKRTDDVNIGLGRVEALLARECSSLRQHSSVA
ncbi:MAG TPA: hypothetical protein VI685_27575, partial [Candidatus Angelobacter sp.]